MQESTAHEILDTSKGKSGDYLSGIGYVQNPHYNATGNSGSVGNRATQEKETFDYMETKAKLQTNNMESDLQEIKEVYSNFKQNVENSIKKSSKIKEIYNI